MSSGFTTFRSYDPGEALEVVRRRHAAVASIEPTKRGAWSYTATNLRLGGIDLGRQATTGFSSTSGRDTDGLRLIVVNRGAAIARVGAMERINDSRHAFSFLHPEANGSFTAGYASIALRAPVAPLRAALELLDCDIDPIKFVEDNWGRNDLPGADLFHGMFSGLLASCEHSTPLLAIDAFRTAHEQLLVLHLADMIAAGSEKSRSACMTHRSGPLRACLEFITAHSQSQFNLAEMARHAGISLRTAQALFAAQLGTTISSYLRSHRLDRVRSRLRAEGDATVTNIALEEGFTHLGEFSRWYARRFGEKPSETLRSGRMHRLV